MKRAKMRDADLLDGLRARLRTEIAALHDQLQQRRAELDALSAVMRSRPPPVTAHASQPQLSDCFGAHVQQQREAAGLTQQQFAQRAGVALKTIGNVEQGRHAATRLIRRRLTLALDALNSTAQPSR